MSLNQHKRYANNINLCCLLPIMSAEYSEDILVQQTTADFFENTLKLHCVYAYNQETFGIDGTLGRKDKKEIVLKRYLQEALAKINPGHPQQVY
ncbi:MAG: hypothetical protein ACKPA7_11320, partial [Sphaerospermopsis kisseleviana]